MPPLPTTLLGALLIVVGVAFVRRHRAEWARQRTDAAKEATPVTFAALSGVSPEVDAAFHRRQYHRRMRASGLIVLLGVLIPAGDWYFEQHPGEVRAFFYYWIGVLGLVALLVVWGLADFIATANHNRGALGRVRRRREELGREVEEVRQALRDADRPADRSDDTPTPRRRF